MFRSADPFKEGESQIHKKHLETSQEIFESLSKDRVF